MYVMCIGACKQYVQTGVERGAWKSKGGERRYEKSAGFCMRVSVVVGVLCTVLGSAAECKLGHILTVREYIPTARVKSGNIYTRRGSVLSSGEHLSTPPTVYDAAGNFHIRRVLNLCNSCARHVHRRVQKACAVRGVGRGVWKNLKRRE
jgi:hypothetical protein